MIRAHRFRAVVTAFAVVAAVMNLAIWCAGAAPPTIWRLVAAGAVGNAYGLAQTLAKATPLALTGVSVAYALRAGLFNIGAEGQLAAGILAAAVVGAHAPGALGFVPAVLAAAIAGAALGALPGWLRGRFGAHEVITTLMLNGLMSVLATWLYGGPLRVGEQVHTRSVVASARLPMLGASWSAFRGSALNASIVMAFAMPFIAAWLLRSTAGGLRIRAVGSNPNAARALGVPLTATYMRAMAVAGAFAGLAGVHFVLGAKGFAEEGMGSGVGFGGIAVAMLAQGRAVGIIGAAILLGALAQGGLAVNAIVPADILAVAQAVLLVAVAALGSAWAREGRTVAET